MKNYVNFSSYKIHWIVLVPDFGIATKAAEDDLIKYSGATFWKDGKIIKQ